MPSHTGEKTKTASFISCQKKETLMASELDSKVRFEIYLHDKRVWDVCQGMIECIESKQKQNRGKRPG